MSNNVTNLFEVLQKNQSHPRLMEQSARFVYDLPFYGEFLLSINFHEVSEKNLDTAGVNVTRAGMNFYWNRNFVEKELKNDRQVAFLLLHEIYHLLFDHQKRSQYRYLNPAISNIVQDMIINQLIHKHFNSGQVDFPFGVLFIPKEYDGDWIFEKLYDWLIIQKRERDEKNGKPVSGIEEYNPPTNGKNSPKPSEEELRKKLDSTGKPLFGKYGKEDRECMSLDGILDRIDNGENGMFFDFHLMDDVSDELKKQIVEDIKNSLRNRGLVSSDVESALNSLKKSKKDYLKQIKRSIVMIKGIIKTPSYKKPNRRNFEGIKGRSRVGAHLNVILDTSGSMGGYFERILSTIFQNGIVVRLLQCDASVHCVENIKNKNKLKKMMIVGGGGTILQPAIDMIVEKYNNLNTIVLTDGFTDDLDLSQLHGKILILSIGTFCRIFKSNGRLKQVIIEDPDNS